MFKRTLIALAAVALVCGGAVAVAYAATGPNNRATCTTNPNVVDKGNSQQLTIVCTVPKVAGPTVTSTATATATAPTSQGGTPTHSASQAPSGTATATAPTSPPNNPTAPAPTSPTATAPPPSAPGNWPGASNTGVPAGTSLSSYTGSCTITSTVTIDAKTINCPGGVDVRAAGVVIRNSKVNGPINVDTDSNRSWSLTLTDSEVNAGNQDTKAAVGNGNLNILRSNIYGGFHTVRCDEHSSQCMVQDSYLHGQYLGPSSGQHLNGIAVFGALSPCTGPNANGVPACFAAIHNTIWCEPAPNASDGGCTADLFLATQFGPLHGALVQNNLFHANPGAAYCTYGSVNAEGNPYDHIVYTGNVFQRGTNNKCGAYGPVTSYDSAGVGNIWSNNTWDTGGTVGPAN